MKLHKIPCCICNSSDNLRLVGIYDGYKIVECKICKLKFVNPQPDKSYLKSIYEDNYFEGGRVTKNYADYFGNEKYIRKISKRRLVIINKHVNRGLLLEIGSATGIFLDEARKTGWNVTGIEISKYARKLSKKKLGISLYSGLVGANIKDKNFDTVVMWDTIEHLSNPRVTLSLVYKKLKPGGRLFFTTGITGDLRADLTFGYSMWYIPPYHLYFFNKVSINKVLQKIGFSSIKINNGEVEEGILPQIFYFTNNLRGIFLNLIKILISPTLFISSKSDYRARWGNSVLVMATKPLN